MRHRPTTIQPDNGGSSKKIRKLTYHQPGTDWYPCRQTAQFKSNYDQIKWRKK